LYPHQRRYADDPVWYPVEAPRSPGLVVLSAVSVALAVLSFSTLAGTASATPGQPGVVAAADVSPTPPENGSKPTAPAAAASSGAANGTVADGTIGGTRADASSHAHHQAELKTAHPAPDSTASRSAHHRGGSAEPDSAPTRHHDMTDMPESSGSRTGVDSRRGADSGDAGHKKLDANPSPSAAGSGGANKSVLMKGQQFSPASITVAVGDTVTWTNQDSVPHNVVVNSGPEKFQSPLLSQGQTFSHTFTKAGEYSYVCSVHPDMVAKLSADAASAPAASGSGSSAPAGSDSGSPSESTDGTTPPEHRGSMNMDGTESSGTGTDGGQPPTAKSAEPDGAAKSAEPDGAAKSAEPDGAAKSAEPDGAAKSAEPDNGKSDNADPSSASAGDAPESDDHSRSPESQTEPASNHVISDSGKKGDRGSKARSGSKVKKLPHIKTSYRDSSLGSLLGGSLLGGSDRYGSNYDGSLLGGSLLGGSDRYSSNDTATGVTSSAAGGTATACGNGDSTLRVLRRHIEYGHLQASPGDQISDLLNLNDYTRAHTVLGQNLLRPILGC
jgi:plastocyanin